MGFTFQTLMMVALFHLAGGINFGLPAPALEASYPCAKTAQISKARSSGSRQHSRAVAKMPVVPFCELVRHPGVYDGKMVITSARYVPGLLFDPACNSQDQFVWLETGALYNSNPAFLRRLDAITRTALKGADRHTLLTVSGRFDSNGSRYGELEQFRMQIVVERLLKVRRTATARTGSLYSSKIGQEPAFWTQG